MKQNILHVKRFPGLPYFLIRLAFKYVPAFGTEEITAVINITEIELCKDIVELLGFTFGIFWTISVISHWTHLYFIYTNN